jgi:uncharacterized membrane protein
MLHRITARGRLLFGLAIAAFGVEHLVCARFGEAVAPVIPWVPGLPWDAYLMGLVLLAAGLCIAADVQAWLAATVLGIVFVLCVLLLQVPRVAVSSLDVGVRTRAFETLAVAGVALTLAGMLSGDHHSRRWIRSGRCLFGVSCVVFGIDHFIVIDFIARLVPAWIPGGLFWAYLTGAGFIAAGLSIATNWLARWGATLLGIMFALWFLVLHAPRILGLSQVAGAPRDPNEWSSAFIALAMCGGAWIFAEASSTG